jgi:hypothetical protein
MARIISPELIDIIKKKEEEKHRDVQIPLHVPEIPAYPEENQPEEKSSWVVIIDLVD